MINETYTIDSHHELQKIVVEMRLSLAGKKWDNACVDVLFSSDSSFQYTGRYMSNSNYENKIFRFQRCCHSNIESGFLTLHKSALKTPSIKWNKCRLIFYKDKSCSNIFEYYFDEPYDRLSKMSDTSEEYNNIPIQKELSILAWSPKSREKSNTKARRIKKRAYSQRDRA